jgi:hypothetical protein
MYLSFAAAGGAEARSKAFHDMFRRTDLLTARCKVRCWRDAEFDASAWIDNNLMESRPLRGAAATRPSSSVTAGKGQSVARAASSLLWKMPEGSVSWSRSAYYFTSALDALFEGLPRSKRVWIDSVKCFCHLCREPVSNMLTHACWWDHVTLHWAMRHMSTVRRHWSCRRVLYDHKQPLLGVARPAGGLPRALSVSKMLTAPRFNPHPRSPFETVLQVEKADEMRRMELASLIRVLNRPPFSCISFSFRDYRSGAVGQGERMFRAEVSRLCQTMIPPCSAETMTRLQQKCWGRKNLEILFDRLRLGEVMEECGVTAATEKDAKGAIMRQMFFELLMAGMDSDVRQAAAGEHPDEGRHGSHTVFDEVRELLVEQALHRMAFELIYLRTMVLLETAAPTWMGLGPPTNEQFDLSGYF